MDLDTVIEKRSSIRTFTSKTPSWKLVLEAIDTANQAPFAGNHNNLKFLIIENGEAIKKLAKFSNQHWIAEASTIVLVLSDDTHLENIYGTRGRVYSRQQAGAAIENFLLKIIDLGLSACWVGAYTDELIKEIFEIPQHIQIEALIPIGYAKEKPAKKRKKELKNSIYWEKWGNDKKAPILKEGPDPNPSAFE